MALPGFYKVNFTDPRKEGFIIEPYQTNGTVSPVSDVLDASAARASTSLLLYGRDVPNYGERIAENFVQLLENFAGPAAPKNPIEGQLWFDTGTIYAVSAWTNATTLVFQGDQVAVFTAWATAATPVTLTSRPLNVKDNTLQQTNLLVVSASLSAGVTSVVFKSTTEDAISLPPNVVGGFITSAQPGYARMRVATNVANALKWIDITNVVSATAAPETTHLTVGDLWYDEATGQLRVYTSTGWTSVAGKYLPLTGGTMTGVIQMGANKIFSSGTITAAAGDLNALVNRKYVDGVQQGLQDQIDDLEQQIDEIGSTELNKKVDRAGDRMTGALRFGATTVLTGPGIDVAGNPLINPLISWNANDYLTASLQPNYAVDKLYIARALSQHLADEIHGDGGFIIKQPDGTGIFPNSVAFQSTAGTSYNFTWKDITGNNEHKIYAQFSGATSQLVLQAGTDATDTIDFRHTLVSANPLYRVGMGGNRSFVSLFLHDGQPQPTYLGAPTDVNDDTAAAAKGFVRQFVADAFEAYTPVDPGAGSYITGANYAYNVEAKTYTLTIMQSEASPIIVNEYHKHNPYDIDYQSQTVEGFEWSEEDGVIETIQEEFPNYPTTNVGEMLRILNVYKAPIINAEFLNPPKVGLAAPVVSYATATKTIVVEGTEVQQYAVAGTKFAIGEGSANDGVYTVVSAVTGTPNSDGPTTNIVVLETIPTNGAEAADGIRARFGYIVPNTEPSSLITRATLDSELGKKDPKYLYFKATSTGTNVVRALGFTYTQSKNKLWVFRNGQKLRVNTLTGGDFNETSATSITIANVYINDEFEIYEI